MVSKLLLEDVANYIWSESYRRLPGFRRTKELAEDVLSQQLTNEEVLYIYDFIRLPE